MKPAFLHVFFFFILLSCTTALDIAVPASPLSGTPTTITWTSAGSSDPSKFDLRFMVDNADVGLAVANVAVGDTTSGLVNVTFPKPGSYVLTAVTGAWPNYIQVGTSNQVTVVQAPTYSALAASAPTSTPSTSAGPGTPSSSASPISASRASAVQYSNRRAILIASCTLGALFTLFIIAAIVIFLVLRRRRIREAEDRRRWTFHQDLMVQPRDQQGASVVHITQAEAPPRVDLDFDLERGVGPEQRQVFATVPFVMRSPKGPRPKTAATTSNYHFVSAGNAGPGNR